VTRAISDEIRYRLLSHLSEHPEASQRELAKLLGVSVGKVNYCLCALIEKGLLKMRNFHHSHKKLSYAYILTPKGIEEKVSVTYRFLRRKIAEYEVLTAEIDRLSREIAESGVSDGESKVVAL